MSAARWEEPEQQSMECYQSDDHDTSRDGDECRDWDEVNEDEGNHNAHKQQPIVWKVAVSGVLVS